MSFEPKIRPVVLCILDGWGHGAAAEDNAITRAETPVWDDLWANNPHSLLQASSADVGLPDGQMGNSEVGHTNIGAGRVVPQSLPRIDQAVADGSLAGHGDLLAFVETVKASGGTCHLMGLMSPGGVHSTQSHLAALARAVASRGVAVAVHAFLDGRDVSPGGCRDYLDEFKQQVAETPGVSIATVSGRYYAMDRDQRWQRVALAYDALVSGQGESAATADRAVVHATARDETDEFVLPTVIAGYGGMGDGDGLLIGNFRADRVRQIAGALMDPDFDGFTRPARVKFAAALGLVEYSNHLNQFIGALFPPNKLTGILGDVVSRAGLKQLRIAETEKYAHVTFFLNGGEERLFPGEERILVPSPRIATYDLQPEMSAPEVTDKLVEAITDGGFGLVVVNYANGGMVGQTGKLDAAMAAVEAVDVCLGRVAQAVYAAGGALVVTADHGNAERMFNGGADRPHTAHTSNPVPFIVSAAAAQDVTVRDGRLADVAPTLLALLELDCPAEMTGTSLLVASDS
ncbi:MAG: 2,3-bisphosphoglycerate-independent phosphoglycerate mutase [Alphaproteobacteria bacterium]